MSFDLSQLRFQVNTEELDAAVKQVGALATAVSKLKKPLSDLGTAANDAGTQVTKGAEAGEASARKQVKQTEMMSQAVEQFYKQKDKLAKQDISNQEKATAAQVREAKTQQDILQRQVTVLGYMNEGWSKGQSSVLAAGKAAGLTNTEMVKLQTTIASQRKIMGQDPFDQSTSGLISLTKELGQAREGYRQLIDYTKRYEAAKALGNGSEVSVMALSKKETDNLYRDKLRAFEIYKQQRVILKEDVAARLSASAITIEAGNKELQAQKVQFREGLRATENHYKNIANIKRPLEDVRTVDATKKRDKLNYLARATSVQLGDIGISLAGGQNPLTVLLQQGDQLRAIFGDIGREGHDMNKVLNNAFTQIVTGFRDVALKLVDVVAIGFYKTAAGAATLAANLTGIPQLLRVVTEGGTLFGKSFEGLGADHGFIKFIKALTPALTMLAATGVLALVVTLATLAIAFKNILATSGELSNALILNGAALAITKKEAMDMSAALATGAATSLDVAKVITEVAQAGNIGKEALQGITTAAIDMNRYLGMSTKDVVKSYSELATDPVKALSEIGLATGRVNASTIERINGLIEEGEKTEAVSQANTELTRVYGEMSQKAIENMTPLGKLWDDMKQSVNLLSEEIYKFANTESVVSTLTSVWTDFANVIKSVLNLVKQTVVVFEAVDKFKSIQDISSGKSLAEREIAVKDFVSTVKGALLSDPLKPTEGIKKSIELQKEYVTVIKDGQQVRLSVMTTELQAQKKERDAIKARMDAEKDAQKYGSPSKLNDTERKKKTEIALGINKRNADAQRAGANPNLAEISQREQSTADGIRTHFKPKKEGGGSGAAGIKDAINSQIEIIQNAQALVERNAKLSVDKINSEHKRGMINDLDYINQVAEAEKASITKAIESFKAQEVIASQKKNSLKEVQKIKGDIEKANDSLAKRELDREYAIAELRHKNVQDTVNAAVTEIQAITDKNKAQKLENELIGLTEEQSGKLRAERANSVIALQAEHVAYLQRNGYAETSALMYNMEIQKLQAMTEARTLDTEALTKQTAAARKKIQEEGDKTFQKESFSLDASQRELDFRNSLIGVYGEQKEAMKQAYELEKGMLEVNRKKTEELEAARKRYNALLTSNPEIDKVTEDAFNKEKAQIEDVAVRQEKLLKEGSKTAIKELEDAKLDKFAEGLSDAVMTGLKDGAQAGKKKLRDLIVAELEKTITLSITANIKSLLTGGSQGGGGGGLLSNLGGAAMQMLTGGSVGASSASLMGANAVGAMGGDSLGALIGLNGGWAGVAGPAVEGLATLAPAITTLGTVATTAGPATVAAGASLTGMATAALAAIPVVGWVALGIGALFAIFSSGKDKIPTVLNDLAMFNNSLVGLPFLELAIGSDEVAQGLRDVLYGLENASPTMRKLAGETVSLSIELMRASGDIAGARNLARNLSTRGMSEKEIGLFDENEKIRDQIEAHRAAASAASEGAAAASALEQAEKQLATERWNLTGKLNILLGRTTQLEFDRATALAAVTDEASLGMLKLIHVLEDLSSAVDKQFATLERSIAAQEKVIAAERKLVEVRLASATALQSALKSAKEATTLTMSRDKAQQGFSQLLALAKATGVLPSLQTLQPLLDSLTTSSEDLFGTFEDYQRDFLKTAYDIKEMSSLADSQVSIEQAALDKLDAQVEFMRLQLETAKAQLDALRGVDTSVNNVAKAIEDFDNAMRAFTGAQKSAATYAATAPTPSAVTGGGGGGGYSGGGGGGGSGATAFEDIAGQENKDIVAAYRAYYNRNPDPSGYKHFIDSLLTGDKLMQAILGASAGNPEGGDFKTAVSKGYNPLDPLAKFLKSATAGTAPISSDDFGSYAVGSNYIPNDQIAQIHKGERILPAADNRELFARLQSPDDNAWVLSQALRELRVEVMELRKSSDKGNENTKRAADTLQGQQGVPFLVEIAK